MTTMPDVPYYNLSLADGTCWLIHAGDPDAARVVAALGAAMQLRPSQGQEEGARELLVTVGWGKTPPANLSGPGPAVCPLSPLLNDDMLNIGVSHLALTIAREAQSRGGVLLHGALAQASPTLSGPPPLHAEGERGGGGILLAGPGTVGKTTASERLPPPWRSLSDDAALVVRDTRGRYWAHPWPTWSRFHGDGPGGSWDVQRAVPLRAVFFLSQSSEDRAEPIHVTQATAMLMEAVQHVSRSMTRHLPKGETQTLYQEQLAAVEALARAIPAYTLHISLAGAFWKEMERVLWKDEGERRKNEGPSVQDLPELSRWNAGDRPEISSFILHPSSLLVVYTGPSMNPTLAEPDLLDVMAYDDRPVRPGDVVYYHPPDEEREVVHRVVQVTPEGIRTRGDNNPLEDPYLLQPDNVIGQVTAAQRGVKRRRIAGGRQGMLVGTACRLRRVVNRGIARLLHGVYRALAGRFDRLLPARLRPRVFAFQARNQTFLKLLMGRHVVGQYDTREEQWRIRRPFRLFVDEASLPVLEPQRCARAASGARRVEDPGPGLGERSVV